jgi:hypothetical protein
LDMVGYGWNLGSSKLLPFGLRPHKLHLWNMKGKVNILVRMNRLDVVGDVRKEIQHSSYIGRLEPVGI